MGRIEAYRELSDPAPVIAIQYYKFLGGITFTLKRNTTLAQCPNKMLAISWDVFDRMVSKPFFVVIYATTLVHHVSPVNDVKASLWFPILLR